MGTTPVFGSMVQNGKLAASMPALVSALNRVDLPTLGRPTIPHLKPMDCYLVDGCFRGRAGGPCRVVDPEARDLARGRSS